MPSDAALSPRDSQTHFQMDPRTRVPHLNLSPNTQSEYPETGPAEGEIKGTLKTGRGPTGKTCPNAESLLLFCFDVQRDVPFVSQGPTKKSDTQAKAMKIRKRKNETKEEKGQLGLMGSYSVGSLASTRSQEWCQPVPKEAT